MEVKNDTRLSELTVGELLEALRAAGIGHSNEEPRHLAYGLKGLADLFHISLSQAKRLKASGMLDKAISQSGRTIIIDKAAAVELFRQATHARH